MDIRIMKAYLSDMMLDVVLIISLVLYMSSTDIVWGEIASDFRKVFQIAIGIFMFVFLGCAVVEKRKNKEKASMQYLIGILWGILLIITNLY